MRASFRHYGAWVLGTIGIGLSAPALAGDHYILLGLEETQAAAQSQAATSGAWVLDTDLYTKLPPNRFAVVQGPFASATIAKEELRFLQSGGLLPGATVKDAGETRLPLRLGNGKVPPAVFTALLGELTVDVEDRPGSASPCEPQEPYQRVDVHIMGLDNKGDGALKAGAGTAQGGIVFQVGQPPDEQQFRTYHAVNGGRVEQSADVFALGAVYRF